MTAANVRITNVCVTTDGGGVLGSVAVSARGAASNTTIDNSAIAGANSSNRSVQIAVANWGSGSATLSHDYIHNCGECVHDGPWTVNDSYVISDGMVTSDHFEDLYCSDTSESLTHDTLLNPELQTATIFCDTNGGAGGACSNHITLTNSLLAGGGAMLYICGNASSAGSSTMTIANNTFARCRTPPYRYNPSTGGTACASNPGDGGADSHGYWPDGGYFFVDAYTYCPPASGQAWSANVWDDNGATVGC